MGFPGQEYWSELPFSSPWDLPELHLFCLLPALASRFFTTGPPGKPLEALLFNIIEKLIRFISHVFPLYKVKKTVFHKIQRLVIFVHSMMAPCIICLSSSLFRFVTNWTSITKPKSSACFNRTAGVFYPPVLPKLGR